MWAWIRMPVFFCFPTLPQSSLSNCLKIGYLCPSRWFIIFTVKLAILGNPPFSDIAKYHMGYVSHYIPMIFPLHSMKNHHSWWLIGNDDGLSPIKHFCWSTPHFGWRNPFSKAGLLSRLVVVQAAHIMPSSKSWWEWDMWISWPCQCGANDHSHQDYYQYAQYDHWNEQDMGITNG
jgi:hypothetical protein